MADPAPFQEIPRVEPSKRPVDERVRDYREIPEGLSPEELSRQAARCLDCGIPFCHGFGCPLANRIPDWNDMLYHGRWEQALLLLHSTNNFPEITGRVCPAPCEAACTLSTDFGAVAIRQIELQLVERGWKEGWIKPLPATRASGSRVAVIGSGPGGLAAAQELSRHGHKVIVFEKDDRIGGMLRYGIPDFKLEKGVIDRRLEQMRREGVIFEPGVEAGVDLSGRYLLRSFQAVVIAAGARTPRDLVLPGRDLTGIHLAMEYLVRQNRLVGGENGDGYSSRDARGKNVVVLGGGDTGSDCVGTARRQGAKEIFQLEILPRPPEERRRENPWPTWPRILRTTTSHEEGCERLWAVAAKGFSGEGGRVTGVRCVKLDCMRPEEGGKEVPGSDFEVPADMVVIAAGFTHPEHGPLIEELGLSLTERGTIAVDDDFAASTPSVFAAGDCVSGASLVVDAISQGRRCAAAVHRFLSNR